MEAFRLHALAFWQGFKAVIPLWLASAPFAIAYSIAAREAGLDSLEIQLMSLTVYSAAAQMATVQLLSAGASALTILMTAMMMNLHHFLYGLSLAKRMGPSRLERAVAAYFLTDSAFAVTLAAGRQADFYFLFGAELSLFLVWNLFTALGMLLGRFAIVSASTQLNFVVPLTFFVLLVLTVKTGMDFLVAVISAAAGILCLSMQLGSSTILIASVAGALIGAWIVEHQNSRRSSTSNTDGP